MGKADDLLQFLDTVYPGDSRQDDLVQQILNSMPEFTDFGGNSFWKHGNLWLPSMPTPTTYTSDSLTKQIAEAFAKIPSSPPPCGLATDIFNGMFAPFIMPAPIYRPSEDENAHRILRAHHNDRIERVWSDVLGMHVRIGEHV